MLGRLRVEFAGCVDANRDNVSVVEFDAIATVLLAEEVVFGKTAPEGILVG